MRDFFGKKRAVPKPGATLVLKIAGQTRYASLAASVPAKVFAERLNSGPLTLVFHEPEGAALLPRPLPPGDGETEAAPGDLLLLGENRLFLCREATRLPAAKIASDINGLDQILSGNDFSVTFSLEWNE